MKRRCVVFAVSALLALGCDSKSDGGGGGGAASSGGGGPACPSWSGTLGDKKISGNEVHTTPAPMFGITLQAYKNGDALDAPMLMGTKRGEEGGKIELLVNGMLGGRPVTSITGTKVYWDKKAGTITGTLEDSKTREKLPVAITYKNAFTDGTPERCLE